MWAIWIWCEQFAFDVSNLFLMWAVCFCCDHFVFAVIILLLPLHLWATVPGVCYTPRGFFWYLQGSPNIDIGGAGEVNNCNVHGKRVENSKEWWGGRRYFVNDCSLELLVTNFQLHWRPTGHNVGPCLIISFNPILSFYLRHLWWSSSLTWFCLFISAIYGGHLLGVRSMTGLAFYDWENTELIRRIEIQPRSVSLVLLSDILHP